MQLALGDQGTPLQPSAVPAAAATMCTAASHISSLLEKMTSSDKDFRWVQCLPQSPKSLSPNPRSLSPSPWSLSQALLKLSQPLLPIFPGILKSDLFQGATHPSSST